MKKVMLYAKYFEEDWWEPVWDEPRVVEGTGTSIQEAVNEWLSGNIYPLDQDGVVGYELRKA